MGPLSSAGCSSSRRKRGSANYASSSGPSLKSERRPGMRSRSWRVSNSLVKPTRYAKRGRPAPGEVPSISWELRASLQVDEARVAEGREPLGKYIIANNELDKEKLPTLELLTVYKDQNRSVERGFRFLKDPWFFASNFFLKKPSRIMGLLMLMAISLLVYALAEHRLRSQLSVQKQTIPDQLGKPTQTPTMRRVFQMFNGIDLFITQRGAIRFTQVLNLQPIHHQILALLGPSIQQFYNSISYSHSWV